MRVQSEGPGRGERAGWSGWGYVQGQDKEGVPSKVRLGAGAGWHPVLTW